MNVYNTSSAAFVSDTSVFEYLLPARSSQWASLEDDETIFLRTAYFNSVNDVSVYIVIVHVNSHRNVDSAILYYILTNMHPKVLKIT